VLFRLECELNEFQPVNQTPEARAAALATVNQNIDAAKCLILSMLTHSNSVKIITGYCRPKRPKT